MACSLRMLRIRCRVWSCAPWARAPWARALPLVAFTLSCGGRAAFDDGDPSGEGGGQTEDPAMDPDPGTSTGASNSMGRGGRGGGSTSTLDPCRPGPLLRDTSPSACKWTVEQRCYEERQAACACACPRDRESRCISSFEGTQVPVICI
jgi:hypothetical protein